MIATLSVVGFFLFRIGLPILILVSLGVAIDRWQTKRNQELESLRLPEDIQADQTVQEDQEDRQQKHYVA